ncbi:TonB-dependent receptor [Aestuariicella hydrocarbonica]|uniref:TonB-dependent receptor n=1 Tax=Pseudomaricurvus hydrocarbonicus TaxID=1470433 RepID=A0A9E5JTE9_9GAMM|nr:TonB-dependent receptor [Aestuariicella hydrocarbonica]NHO65161.1 TonB-dependent receptor [Aestuariicella hydrocarbonica]
MKKISSTAGLLLAASGMSLPAFAEQLMLEEIVITAQKQSESLQEVPISVTALGQDSLGNFKFRNTQEIASQAPNVQMLGSNGDAQLVLGMRGVTQSDYSPNGTGAVALYVDEVYMGATPLSSGVQLFDLERVEMLLGPQGTLYGKNATGGAVNLITTKPQMDGTSGYLNLGLGNYGAYNVAGAFDTELSETLGMRLAFTTTENDGYVENKLPGADDASQIGESAVRLSFLYETDSVDALLKLHKSRTRANHTSILMVEADQGVANGGVGLGHTGYGRGDLDFQETESNRVEEKEFDLQGTSLTLNYHSDSYTFTSITSFDKGEYFVPEDADGSPYHLLEDDFYAETKQFTQDLRITSNYAGNFNFIAGLYYATDTTDGETRYRWLADYGDDTQPLANACEDTFFLGCYYANSYEQTRDTQAAYFNSTYQLTNALTLTAGVRYTRDSIEIEDYTSWYGEAQDSFAKTQDGPAQGSLGLDGVNDKVDDTNWSGKLGLDWFVTDDIMLYGSYSTGYRGSAFNGFAFIPDEFTQVDPEELEAWEFGFKSTLFGGSTRLNGAVFHYTYENQQFLIFDAGLQRLLNAGESEIQGLELQLTTQLTERLTVNAGVGLLDAEYTELSYAGADLSGNTLPSSPEVNLNLSADYDLYEGDGTWVQLHYDASYISEQFFEPFNEKRLAQEGYTIHNVRLNVALQDEKHSFGVYVKNLTDEDYAVYSVNLEADWNGLFFFRGAPRTYGIDYKYNF